MSGNGGCGALPTPMSTKVMPEGRALIDIAFVLLRRPVVIQPAAVVPVPVVTLHPDLSEAHACCPMFLEVQV